MLGRLIRIRYFRLDTLVILQLGQSLLSLLPLLCPSLPFPFPAIHKFALSLLVYVTCIAYFHCAVTLWRFKCDSIVDIGFCNCCCCCCYAHTHTLAHTLKWGALYRPYQASWVAAGKKRLCAYLAHLRPLCCCCCCCWCYSCPITNRNFSDTYINWPLSVAFPPSSSSSPSCRAASCQAIKRQNTWLTFRRQLFFFFWVVCCCSLSLFVVFWDFFFRFVC